MATAARNSTRIHRATHDNPSRPFAHREALDCRPLRADLAQRLFWLLAPLGLVIAAIALMSA